MDAWNGARKYGRSNRNDSCGDSVSQGIVRIPFYGSSLPGIDVESRELDDDLVGLGSNCTRFSSDCGRDRVTYRRALYYECHRAANDGAISGPPRCAPCVPRRSLSRCPGWRGGNIRAQSSRIDLGACSLGSRHVRGLPNGDENTAQPGGTDTICRTSHCARHSLDERTLDCGDRSGARRNTHRPRWLEDGLHGEPSSGAPRNPARISLDSRRSNKTGWAPKTNPGN